MVDLAMRIRLQNLTMEIILREIEGKKRINPKDGKCLTGNNVPDKKVHASKLRKTSGKPSDEDIKTGLVLFHAAQFCPTLVVKMHNFIDQLLAKKYSRTIIQTIVGLFQLTAIEEENSFNLTKQFYQILASTLDLQYGNLLLATSTKAQLQAVMRNKWPFFTNYTDLVEDCLREEHCSFLQNVFRNLGKSYF